MGRLAQTKPPDQVCDSFAPICSQESLHRLLRLRNDPQIRLWRLPAARVFLLRVFIRDGAADDDVITRFPVHRRGDAMFGRELERGEDTQNFVEVASRAHRIAELQLDFLVWTDDEY